MEKESFFDENHLFVLRQNSQLSQRSVDSLVKSCFINETIQHPEEKVLGMF